jgi:hypothetical protein
MNRVLVIALVLAMAVPASGVLAAGAGQTQGVGSITGVVHAGGNVAATTTVRLRALANGQLAQTATTNALGQFTFAGLNPGDYMIEVVSGSGDIIGTSTPVSVAAGAAVAGVEVTTAATVAKTAGKSFFTSTLGIVSVAAAGAAVAGVTVAANRPTASGSQ